MKAIIKGVVCGLIIGAIGCSVMMAEHIVRNHKLDNQLSELLAR